MHFLRQIEGKCLIKNAFYFALRFKEIKWGRLSKKHKKDRGKQADLYICERNNFDILN